MPGAVAGLPYEDEEFPTLTITVNCEEDQNGCDERVSELTARIGEYAGAAVKAKAKADKEGDKITRKAAADARRVLKSPEQEARRIKSEGKKAAGKQRKEGFTAVRKDFQTRKK
jgi:hypothetical protein